MVGDEFEMGEDRIARMLLDALQEKLEDRPAGLCLEVEGAVDEPESPCTAPMQLCQLLENPVELERPGGLVECRQTELALVGAASRGLDIEVAMGDVDLGVMLIGQHQRIEFGLNAGDHFHQRPRSLEQLARQHGKAEVGRAGDHMVGHLHDRLFLHLVADFRAADHDPDLGCRLAQPCNQLGRSLDIPDIHPEADEPWFALKQALDHAVERRCNREFLDAGA